jgi:acyl-coenzyme A synthetase/AMP-(fatty) acid ligase
VRMAASPYIGLTDPTRWSDGWLSTRDAAAIDPDTGQVTILGRLDSQIAIGGLKVDLTEVEQTINALPQVQAAVVCYENVIETYLTLTDDATVPAVESAMTEQLAPFKRPRRVYALSELPRTATGKVVRDRKVLQAAVEAAAAVSR